MIWLYTQCYNEEYMLPFFLRHYETFVDRMIFYDAHSEDTTQELILAHPKAELREPPYPSLVKELDDNLSVEFANQQYKEARGKADWVIWVDIDEFLHHPDILGILDSYRTQGVNLPRIRGYLMIGDAPVAGPGQLTELQPLGLPDRMTCKPCILNPTLGEINWSTGKHGNHPSLDAAWSDDRTLRLLHYRYFGPKYLAARNARQYSRLCKKNKAEFLGAQVFPNYEGEWDAKWYATYGIENRTDVVHF